MRKRYDDPHKVGPSEKVPFIPGEDPQERHARRLQSNLTDTERLEEFLRSIEFEFEIKNYGHHWIMKRPRDGQYIEWWPSSAKLIFDKYWNDGHHCHDVDQVIAVITERLQKEKKGK